MSATCLYIFKKGAKMGQYCPIHPTSGNYCGKHKVKSKPESKQACQSDEVDFELKQAYQLSIESKRTDDKKRKENEHELSKRIMCQYNEGEKRRIQVSKTGLLSEFELNEMDGKSPIFENQELIATKVCCVFKDRRIINVMVLAKTQSGKTGSMCATIKQYIGDPYNLIPVENIFIITGLSDCEWLNQTRERLPAKIKVYHRNSLLTKFTEEIKDKKNILIIMDEIHVASKKNQTLYKCFEQSGILDKQILYERDIKIVEYTATPGGTLYDLMKWGNASQKILGEPGDGYTSSYDLYNKERVKQYKDLCGYDEKDEKVLDNIREIKEIIDLYDIYFGPLYHIIRTKHGIEHEKTIENFKKIFINNYAFICYVGESEIKDINLILGKEPEKQTFIFLKEKMRCAKTLIKKNIGIMYERYCKIPDDDTVIQGLIGRDTGYDNNDISIHFTNVESIIKYEKLWNSSGFEDKSIKWNSKTTGYKNGLITSKPTINNPTLYGFDSDENQEAKKEPFVFICKTFVEAVEKCKEKLPKSNGPKERYPNQNGFYEATIRSQTKVFSYKEVNDNKGWGINNKNKYRLHPCYQDINDKNTLKWVLVVINL
jgi:hypothetical protein